MRIVIDLQSAQVASAAQRGASYGQLLSQALVRSGEGHEILLALNGFIEESILPIRAAFDGLLPRSAIRLWYAPGPLVARNSENRARRRIAEIIRESFLAALNPDCVLLIDPFYGADDEMVATIGAFSSEVPTLVVMEPVVPPNRENIDEVVHFLRQAEQLKRSSGVFARGGQSGEGLGRALGISEAQIHALGEFLDSADLSAARDAEVLLTAASSLPGRKFPEPTQRELPRLAYVSPLPPERTGIADYSAELLPSLSAYYAIDVVTDQPVISDPWILANCEVRSVSWFAGNGGKYERVLYQIGNSHFHSHMFDLLEEIPGVVVLHDFFLGDAQWHREAHAISSNAWTNALYVSHGYRAVQHRLHERNQSEVIRTYPANFEVVASALGVIVHAEHSRRLCAQWYSENIPEDWAVIPHLRVAASRNDRATCRKQLHFDDTHFVVCSFGFVGPTKLNHELFHAWLGSALARNKKCILVFVGEAPDSEYGQTLRSLIAESAGHSQIRITGYLEPDEYRGYLVAADLAVQLRAHSRGESSGTVLDCMNHGTPVIANANGAMAELPDGSAWVLPDDFAVEDLVCALELMFADEAKRLALSVAAMRTIAENHAPANCAKLYQEALERFHRQTWKQEAWVASKVAVAALSLSVRELADVSEALAATFPKPKPSRCIYVDVTGTCMNDLRTGVERVARALSLALMSEAPPGWRVEPICLDTACGRWWYRTAQHFAMDLLACPSADILEQVVEPAAGDIVLILDISGDRLVSAARSGLIARLRARDVKIYCLVHDLLPLQLPHTFPPGANCGHERWLHAVLATNGAICVSKSVADDLRVWLETNNRLDSFLVTHYHHGADLASTAPTRGVPPDAGRVLHTFNERLTFLLVGTIEPRKRHLQVIDAFTELWRHGVEANLAIVGREGWQDLPEDMRRTIPETAERLRSHPELNNRLFWLEGISDEYLEQIYGAAGCLIAASEGEGFGLPLIEAAANELPIIARDIPVFREVAGEHAFYFQGANPENLKEAILEWLSLYEDGLHPVSAGMPWLTWTESACDLLKSIGVLGHSVLHENTFWRN